MKYYKLLMELRIHVSDEISLHTADTLNHSSRDDAGDLSSYGNHDADAGTDTFDRDFALSLVSNEQEALNEIEEAIMRIKEGSYGVCEITGKPIPAARLVAVPFARYSVEGQAEYEKTDVARQTAHRASDYLATLPMLQRSHPAMMTTSSILKLDPIHQTIGYRLLFVTAFPIFTVDQITKAWIFNTLPLGSYNYPGSIEVIPDFFYIVHIGNEGAAWGMLSATAVGLWSLL